MTDWSEKAEFLTAVQESGWKFENDSDELMAESDFVLAAVKSSGYALRSAADEMKDRSRDRAGRALGSTNP